MSQLPLAPVVLNWLTKTWSGGMVMGLVGWLLVLITLDPSGSYPQLIEGPGITLDESFNVQQGVLLVEALRAYGLFLFDPVNVEEVFGGKSGIPYLPDHPPLGRWILGLAHHLCWMIAAPESPVGPAVTACARTGSATLYGLTIFLIGSVAGRWFGSPAGWFAAISVVLMPRLFGHAHLASLETAVNFTYSLAVLGIAIWWSKFPTALHARSADTDNQQLLSWKCALLPGLLLGLAMLTKIQGFLIIPPVLMWAIVYWRVRGLVAFLIWGLTGGCVFVIGWPWLWLDLPGHLSQFLGAASDRVSLNVFYFGKTYADIDVPWHYPWVMFALTVPAGLQLLGLLGSARVGSQWRGDPGPVLAGLCILFPLLLFSTGIAVYDGTRLFLMVFPLWGLFIGLGVRLLWDWLREITSVRLASVYAGLFFLLQGWGMFNMHPCQLSYYNLLTGGLQGAHSVGMEVTYWGDSITRSLLEECLKEVPKGTTIEVTPVLHQFQCEELAKQSPLVRSHGCRFVPFDVLNPLHETQDQDQPRYVLVFYRYADLPEMFHAMETEPVSLAIPLQQVARLERRHVTLAALWKTRSVEEQETSGK